MLGERKNISIKKNQMYLFILISCFLKNIQPTLSKIQKNRRQIVNNKDQIYLFLKNGNGPTQLLSFFINSIKNKF